MKTTIGNLRAYHRIVFLLTSVLASSQACAAPYFQGLGDLPGGSIESMASAVSGNGLVVVGSASSALGTEAFRWSFADGMSGLGDLSGGAFFSQANAVSADGSVIVGVGSSDSGPEAFRWVEGGGMMGLGDLAGGVFNSVANGVSADGSVVVGTGRVESGKEAFRWTQSGGMVGMGFPPFLAGGSNVFSEGVGVSADGLVVVGVGNDFPAFGSVAYRWTDTTGMVTLGILPNDAHSPSSRAMATSADGSVVVGASTSDTGGPPGNEAFRWTASEGMVGLGFIPDTFWGAPGTATAVSADGSVIVGTSDTSSGQKAFIWTAGDGIRLLQDILSSDLGLDLTGWTLETATGISDDGLTIVGTGINPDGNTEAFIARLPEPGAFGFVAVGLAVLVRRRRM